MNWERITYMITTKYTFVREGISSISTHHRPVSFVSSIPNLLKQKVSSMSCEWCSLSGIWWSNKASILRCCSFQYLLRTRKQSLLGFEPTTVDSLHIGIFLYIIYAPHEFYKLPFVQICTNNKYINSEIQTVFLCL